MDPRLIIALVILTIIIGLLFVAAAFRAGAIADDATKRARDAGAYGDHPALPRKLIASHDAEDAA